MNDSNINTNDSNNDDSINKYSNEKQRQYSGNNGDQFSSSCRHRHKTAFGINTDGTCCAVCCSYSPAGGADLSMPSPLLANCAPPGHSQPLGVDPAKSPLSRFDLILLRSFQAVAAPAGVAAAAAAASSSICSTTSSRQSSLVSTADQQQLLQSMEFGDCCSLSCCSISSVDEHQQHHRGCEEVQEPTAADDGTGTKSANANGNSNADADGDQLLLLSALLSSSSLSSFSSTCSARHGSGVAQLWQRCTIEEESIAEECGGGDGTASADAIIGRVNGNDCEDDDTGTDCGGHGEEEEKKSQLPLSALLPADKRPTNSANANGQEQQQQHQQQQQQRTPVAKTTSCSTSSSGVSSSPNNNAGTIGSSNNGSSKISRLIVRRHSAFQLPQRFTAAASVAIGKLSGASPPPPSAKTTAPMLCLYNGPTANKMNSGLATTNGAIDDDVRDDDDDDEDDENDNNEDGTTERPAGGQSGGGVKGSAMPSPAPLSHQLTMVATKQQLLKHTLAKSDNADKIVEDKANVHVGMQQLLAMRDDGMELAFERCKVWSKYVSQLLQIVKLRLTTEEDYVNKLRRQSEQAKALLSVGTAQTMAANVGKMPLVNVFERMLDGTMQQTIQAECALAAMQQRVVLTLENRQKEHDQRRRKLKTEWAKQRKQLDVCVEELRRAKQTHLNKDEHYLRAKELRQEQEFPMIGTPNGTPPQMCALNGGGGSFNSSKDQLMLRKRVKEMEKRRKAEEEALHRKSDAENDVKRLERELEERMFRIHSLRHHTVNELSDLIRQCELTTIAATSTLLKSLADLWEAVPGQFHRLADVSRSNAPGADFLSFLQSLPSSDSCASSCWRDCDDISSPAPIDQHPQSRQLNRSNNNSNNNNNNNHHHHHHHHHRHHCNSANSSSNNGTLSTSSAASSSVVPMIATTTAAGAAASSSATAGTGGACASVPSSSVCRVQQRRNALSSTDDAPPAKLMMTPSQHKRKGKAAEMTARLFDMQSSSSSSTQIQPSDAARSHRLARTRQVSRCSQCGQLLIFDAVKCQCCGLLSHKKCLGSVQLWCGEKTAKRLTECGADRRMSIFGVPLSESLRTQHRKVPFILERCVDELERRGMRCKGLYRTCGVKSKVEWICVQFEQIPSCDVDIDLSDVHPMNIASVVKLYLRRLPEPLLSHELYGEWLRLDTLASNGERTSLVSELRELVERLPDEAFTTLKFLILHLNRVSWFEADNLMSVSNLAAVIAPSLMWPSNYGTHSAAISDAHRQSKAVEVLTRHAHEVFDVNFALDWRTFFDSHPNVPEPSEDSAGAIGGTTSDCGAGNGNDPCAIDNESGDPSRQDANASGSRHAIIGDCGADIRRGVAATTTTTTVDLSAEDDDELVEDDVDDEEDDELLEDDDVDEEEEEEEQLIMASTDNRNRHGRSSGSAKNGSTGGEGRQMPTPVDERKHHLAVFEKRLLVDSYSSSDLECGSSAATTHHQQLFRATTTHYHHQQQQQQSKQSDQSNGTNANPGGRQLISGTTANGNGRPPAPPTVPSAPQSPLLINSARSRQLSAAPRGSLPVPPSTAPQQRRVSTMATNGTTNSNHCNGTPPTGANGKKFGERSYTTSILVSPHLRGMKEALAMDMDDAANNKKAAAMLQQRTPTPKLGLTQKHKSMEEMANCRLGSNGNGTGTKLGGKLFRALAGTGTGHGHGHSPLSSSVGNQQQKLSLASTDRPTVAAGTVHDRSLGYYQHHNEHQHQRNNMVLSGEVTVQLKKDQHFLATDDKRQQQQKQHRPCFKSAILASNDNDVSYV